MQDKLRSSADQSKYVAIGTCGLDYDRLFDGCSQQDQAMVFEKHFELAEEFKLPMYFHVRSAFDDFVDLLGRNRGKFSRGMVHCFTGSASELQALLKMDLFIGVTALSFRTEENLEMVKQIPLEKLLIATNGPFSSMNPNFAGFEFVKTQFKTSEKEDYTAGAEELVRARNEPCCIVQTIEVLAALFGMSEE